MPTRIFHLLTMACNAGDWKFIDEALYFPLVTVFCAFPAFMWLIRTQFDVIHVGQAPIHLDGSNCEIEFCTAFWYVVAFSCEYMTVKSWYVYNLWFELITLSIYFNLVVWLSLYRADWNCGSADLSTKFIMLYVTLCDRYQLCLTCRLICLLLILTLFYVASRTDSKFLWPKGLWLLLLFVLDHVLIWLLGLCIWSGLCYRNTVCYMLIWFIIIKMKCIWVIWHGFVTCQVFHILWL